ncbi:MAG TPA: hypothetical protein VHT91_12055, partial [Kofleriaceae bacterium]|nr:hypothetical protein [Kofleriaceae bacterium]
MGSSEPRKPVDAEPEWPAPPEAQVASRSGEAAPSAPPEATLESIGAAGAGAAAEAVTGRSETAAIDRQAALRALRNLEATEARLERNARREAEETRGKLVQ